MLCALAALICLDVASRTLKLFPTPWTFDVCQHLLCAITFLGAPWVLRENGHIAIELVVERLASPARAAARRAADAVGAATCLLLLVFSCRVLWLAYAAGSLVFESFAFPEWYLYVLPPPVFALLLALYLRSLLRGASPTPGAA